jgi:hypothetical protein
MLRTLVAILISFAAGIATTVLLSSGIALFKNNRFEYHPHGSSFVVFDKKLGIVHYYDGKVFKELDFPRRTTSTHEDFSVPDARPKFIDD